jgi:hypothetical protein
MTMGLYHTALVFTVGGLILLLKSMFWAWFSLSQGDGSVYALVVCGRIKCLKNFPLIFFKGSFSSVTLNEGM